MSAETLSIVAAEVPDPLRSAERARTAFQPIVGMTSLKTHGFEALTRLAGDSGFASLHELMDCASARGELRPAERVLITRSVKTFGDFGGASAVRLFVNVDNRVFDDPDVDPSFVAGLARRSGIEPANLCMELSERRPPESVAALKRLVEVFIAYNVRIAIDDFGRGFSGLEMLMQVNPHYLKIDRAFIDGVSQSPRRQAIVNKVAGLAHSLGIAVIAEGVETEADFRAARELGCDLAQGYLIARPTENLRALRLSYDHIRGRARSEEIAPAVAALIREVEPLKTGDQLCAAVERFKARDTTGLIPVVDEHGHVHGAVYEDDVRHYLFGDYGTALLANRGIDHDLGKVMRRCPISEASVPPEALVESYVVSAGNQGRAHPRGRVSGRARQSGAAAARRRPRGRRGARPESAYLPARQQLDQPPFERAAPGHAAAHAGLFRFRQFQGLQ
ncbi:MAG: EAL domain-containing protein [Sphingomonadaceae bacterium]